MDIITLYAIFAICFTIYKITELVLDRKARSE